MLDLASLLEESKHALWHIVAGQNKRFAHAAARITNDFNIYDLWCHRHEELMLPVATAEGRFGQPKALRSVGARLIQKTALVDYLREKQVPKATRERLLKRFRRHADPRRALLEEHRDYVLAVTSEACVDQLLRKLGDPLGPRLLEEYRHFYGESFARFSIAGGDQQLPAEEQTSIPHTRRAESLRLLLIESALSPRFRSQQPRY